MGYLTLHVDFLITEGNISNAHGRVASVNFIILITPKGKKKSVAFGMSQNKILSTIWNWLKLDQWDGSVAKGACCQASGTEFDPWNSHSEMRENWFQ